MNEFEKVSMRDVLEKDDGWERRDALNEVRNRIKTENQKGSSRLRGRRRRGVGVRVGRGISAKKVEGEVSTSNPTRQWCLKGV